MMTSIRTSAGRLHRRFHLWRGIRALEGVPSSRRLAELRYGWGNERWAADVDFLEATAAHAAGSGGHILECGSGLTTLVLAAISGTRVWSLEHSPEWFARTEAALRRYGLHANLRLCPLQRHHGGFDWYAVPRDLPKTFSLVICDGPPWDTHGGRYGLMPVLHGHMTSPATILLDDADRDGEVEALRRWRTEFGATREIRGRFAVVHTV